MVALSLVLVLVALVLYFGLSGDEDWSGVDNSTGTLAITLINPYAWGAAPCEYFIYLNGELAANGTVAVSGYATFERNFTWAGSELTLSVNIDVPGGSASPEDRTILLASGETESLVVILSSTY